MIRRWSTWMVLMTSAATIGALAMSDGVVAASTTTAPSGGSSSSSPGITAKTVTVGQVTDISQPVPGLFRAAADGTKAYIDYINSMGGVNGRKIVFDGRDSDFSSATVVSDTENQAKNDFALVGGYSLLDGAEQPTIDENGIPDVAYPLSTTLANDSHVYSPSPSTLSLTPTGIYKWAKSKFSNESGKVGILYSAATPSTVQSEAALENAMKAQGFKILYRRGFSALETQFTTDVVKMKNAGVQMFLNQELPASYAGTEAQEASLQGYNPTNIESIAAYAENMGKLSAGTAKGMYLAQQAALFQGEDAKVIPAVGTFDKWVKKVDPNVFSTTTPFTALFGWSSAQLFAQALKAAGPNPTRAQLFDQLNKVTSFNASGLLPPGENPAQNIPSKCFLIAQFDGTSWKRVSPTPKSGFVCSPSGYYKQKGYHPESR